MSAHNETAYLLANLYKKIMDHNEKYRTEFYLHRTNNSCCNYCNSSRYFISCLSELLVGRARASSHLVLRLRRSGHCF